MRLSPLPDHGGRLGVYELVRRLGQGGMGTVYLGSSPDGRLVAVKVVRAELSEDPGFLDRFRSEVARVRQVPSFSTAAVIDADLDHDPPYLVVEYVDGPTLAEAVRESGPLDPSILQNVAIATATALVAIHGAGVIHRDLKPANVLLTVGGVKVIDFGIARALDGVTRHTRADQVVGTVEYMAPERLDSNAGGPAGTAADIFSWGVVVAYAASGRTPFAADSATATAVRILTQPPELSRLQGSLRQLVEWALAKDPRGRPSAEQLLTSLTSGRISTTTVPPPQLAPTMPQLVNGDGRGRSGKRTRLSMVIAAAVVLLFCAPCLFSLRSRTTITPNSSTGRKVSTTSSVPDVRATPPPVTSAVQSAILAGKRRFLIHAADADLNVVLPPETDAVLADTSSGDAQFSLFHIGDTQYAIESAAPPVRPLERCIGVHLDGGKPVSLRQSDCSTDRPKYFVVAPTGDTDDTGRPTYHLSSKFYGEIRWNEKTLRLTLGQSAGNSRPAIFSLVDLGPI